MTIRVAVCVPSYGQWHHRFGLSLADMLLYAAGNPPSPDFGVTVFSMTGSILPDVRQGLADKAVASEATHALCLDSDMTFPRDTLHRLLKHGKTFAAANYSNRRLPNLKPTAHKDGKRINSVGKTGLEAATFVGFGCALIQTDLLKMIERPHFAFGWLRKGNECAVVGEDVYFCRKAAELGHVPHIDHDLSREIGHVGEMEFFLDMIEGDGNGN